MSDSTLRVSALLSVRREMVGWDAGVRLGARAAAGAGGVEETSVTSPPSPSPPEDEGGVCSKNVPSSRGENEAGEVKTHFYAFSLWT